ncbi:hypothetical protein GGF42_008338, partial [Coemansia sp. RSA 2424]
SVVAVLRLVLPDKQRVDNESHPLNRDPVTDHDWFVSRVGKAGLWSANQALVKHLLEVALARIQQHQRRSVASGFIGGSNSSAAYQQQQQSPPPPPSARALLEMAYIVYSGVLVYFGNGQQAMDEADANQRLLPVYLRSKAARGRGVVLVSAEILLACMSQLTGGASLDRLAAAVIRPTPEMFTSSSANNSPLSSSSAAECISALLTGLRCSVTTLLRQKPMAVKDATAVLSAVQILAGRLSELAFHGSNSLAYRCLHQTAEWTVELVRSEMPSDLGLMKSLVGQLTCCQAFLQPEAIIIGNTGGAAVGGGSRVDDAELGPVGELTARMCAASRAHTKDLDTDDDNEDDEVDDQDLEKFTLRSIPALATVLMAWLKGELHRVDWAISQIRRCAHIEQSQQQQSGNSDDDVDLRQSIKVERRICQRLCAVAQQVLEPLLSGTLPKAMYDLVIRAFQDLHKTLALLTRAKMGIVQLPITESYIDALSLICSDLNTHAYALITSKYSNMIGAQDSTEQQQSAKKGKLAKEGGVKPKLKSKVMRDSSLVSSLVYQMELSEKYVIQLSAKFKTPLAHYLKLSTARDFRITKSHIPMAVISDNDDEEAAVGMAGSASPVHQHPSPTLSDADEEEEEEEVVVSDSLDQDEG